MALPAKIVSTVILFFGSFCVSLNNIFCGFRFYSLFGWSMSVWLLALPAVVVIGSVLDPWVRAKVPCTG